MMRLADCFRYKRCQNFDADDFLLFFQVENYKVLFFRNLTDDRHIVSDLNEEGKDHRNTFDMVIMLHT